MPRKASRCEETFKYFRWAKGCACCNQDSVMCLRLLLSVIPGSLFLSGAPGAVVAREVQTVHLEIKALTTIPGRDRDWDWWQARTAFVPASERGKGRKPLWITTMSETGRGGVHNFHDIYQAGSRD